MSSCANGHKVTLITYYRKRISIYTNSSKESQVAVVAILDMFATLLLTKQRFSLKKL